MSPSGSTAHFESWTVISSQVNEAANPGVACAPTHDERETQDNGRGSVRAGHRGVDRGAGNCISIGAMNRPRAASCNATMACGRLAGTAVPADPSQGLKKGKESGWKARLPGPVAAFATTSQPYWTILPPWGPGLTIPRKQFERVSGARPFLRPGSTSWTSSMAQAGSAPKLRPDPPSQHQDSPVRREPGGAWPPTPRRAMWPPLPPGFGGRRLSRSARVR
jgi:hypothetical protein